MSRAVRRARDAVNRAHPALLALLLSLALGLLSVPLADRFYLLGLVDIGEYLNNPFRMLHGELPYRDFWLFFPPGEVFLPYWIYRLFGLRINAVLVMNVALNVVTASFSFVLARQLVKEHALALVTALVVFFDGVSTLTGMAVAFEVGQYFLCLVVAAIALVQFVETGRVGPLYLCGIGVGWAAFFRLFDTAPALIAFLLVIVLQGYGRRAARPAMLASLGAFAGGIATVAVGLGVIVWPIWPLMVRETTIGALAHHFRFYHYVHPWSPLAEAFDMVLDRLRAVIQSWQLIRLAKLGFRAYGFVNTVVLYLLPLVVAWVGGFLIWKRYLKPSQRTIVVAFLVWGFLGLGKSLKYPALHYWTTGVTPLFFVFMLLVQQVFRRNLATFKPWLAGIACVLMLSIPVGIGATAFRLAVSNEPIAGPHGSLRIEDHEYAGHLRQLIAFILNQTREGEYMFVAPYSIPPLYAMTGRRNPSYYDSPQVLYADRLAGLPTDDEEAAICRELVQHPTQVVITEHALAAVGSFRVLQQCLETHFRFAKDIGPYAIYVARTPSHRL